jgi:tetratricopeptide (TPR) repeat protein
MTATDIMEESKGVTVVRSTTSKEATAADTMEESKGATVVGSTTSKDVTEADIMEASKGIGSVTSEEMDVDEMAWSRQIAEVEPSAAEMTSGAIEEKQSTGIPTVNETIDDRDQLLKICSDMVKEVINWRIEKHDPAVFKSKQLYAEILTAMGKSGEAKDILVDLIMNYPNCETTVRLIWMRMLITALEDLGDFRSAFDCVESLSKEQSSLGNCPNEERKTNRMWAHVYMKQGTYQSASNYFNQVKKELPSVPTGVESLRDFAEVANFLAKSGDFISAKRYQEVVLSKVNDFEIGKDVLSICIAKHNFAESVRGCGEYDEARKLHEENVAFLINHFGVDHLHTLRAKDRLADTYSDMGMRNESVKYLREVVDARVRQLGAEHADTVLSKEKLVRAWFKIVRNGLVIGDFW